MNGLKLRNTLSYANNRSFYSIAAGFHCHDIANVNTGKFLKKPNKSPIFAGSDNFNNGKVMSTIPMARSYAIKATKYVNFSSNKTNTFIMLRGHGNCGLFGCQSFILPNVHNEPNNCKSIRHFSDTLNASVDIPASLELEGFWKDLSESATVEFCQNSFVWLHTATGLPWWATIIVATWGIRSVVTLPLALYQFYIQAKVENLKFEMNDIVKRLKIETNYAVHKFNWTEDYARAMYNRSLKKQWQNLIVRDNCHPMKSVVILIVQIPMWVVLSTALRNLCYMLPYPTQHAHAIYLELTTGGCAWFTNLAAVDHTFALPITLGLLNLTIIEMQTLLRSTESSKTQKYLTNFFRLVAVGMVPLASYVPAGISLYWASSSAFGIVQNLMLLSPRVRRFARIPPTDSELEDPYRHLYKNFRRRIGLEEVSLQNSVKKL